MLTAYQTATQALLQNPGAPATLYSPTDITRWINTARGQVAGDGKCVRFIGTVPTVIGQRPYTFSSISFTNAAIGGALNVRRIYYSVGTGQKVIWMRSWPWFDLYYLNNPVPVNGYPQHAAQHQQGAASPGVGGGAGTAATGSFYLDPPPDAVYTLNCDCNCWPISLVDDTTVEAVPYPFTDAVPFLAAYYALMSSQTTEREAQAARMYQQHYQTFLQKARGNSNPTVLPTQYEQAPNPTIANQLGLRSAEQQ